MFKIFFEITIGWKIRTFTRLEQIGLIKKAFSDKTNSIFATPGT